MARSASRLPQCPQKGTPPRAHSVPRCLRFSAPSHRPYTFRCLMEGDCSDPHRNLMKSPPIEEEDCMTRVGFWFLIGVTAWTCWAAANVPLGEERAYALSAQKAARFPVIIVFDENAPFHRFEGGK